MKPTKVDLLLIAPAPIFRTIPLGLMSIAAYVRSKGFSVEILVDNYWGLKKKLVRFDLRQTVVGFSATTDVIEEAIELCDWMKTSLSPEIYCIIGGIHATVMPQETLAGSKFDCLVQGEGEASVLEILEQFFDGSNRPYGIAGTWERGAAGEILKRPSRPMLPNLDDLPFPAFDLVDFNLWKGGIRTGGVHCKNVAVLLTSRGCPYQCVFCGSKSMWARKIRTHSIPYCLELMEELIGRYQLDGFSFLDDELVTDKKRILALCAEIRRRGLHRQIRWEAHSTATSANEEVFRAMKEAGCVNVRIGLESGSEKILKFLKKGQATIQKNYLAVKAARNAGLSVFGSFILGSPEETLDDVLDTINFIKDVGLNSCAVFVAVPYPGTELFTTCREKGYLRPGLRYQDYVMEGPSASAIIRNDTFSSEQLDAIQKFINIQVVEPLNNRGKIPDVNFRLEIEKILQGDLTLTHYTLPVKLKSAFKKFTRRLGIAIRDPKMIIYYFSRRY